MRLAVALDNMLEDFVKLNGKPIVEEDFCRQRFRVRVDPARGARRAGRWMAHRRWLLAAACGRHPVGDTHFGSGE
eukprot:3443153-Pyramimonas_sp.AAC.1